MILWPRLLDVLHPADRPPPESWQTCYEAKYALARLLAPRRIFEIGVRAGYSAFVFLTACPSADYLGIDANTDTHGGFAGAISHARKILGPFRATVLETTTAGFADTFAQSHATSFDLVHIDGDHTNRGCAFDLEFSLRLNPQHIVVDDYREIPDVRAACDQFCDSHSSDFTRLVIDDGHNGFALLTRC